MTIRLTSRTGPWALAALLAFGTGAFGESPASSPVRRPVWHGGIPKVSYSVTDTKSYELRVRMTVDGRSRAIDRIGTCRYTVQRYRHAPTPIEAIGQWSDDLPGAVATILSDQEAVIVELPSLCPGPAGRKGDSPRQMTTASPLVEEARLAHYTPAVIWIRDVRHIDSFELYPSIQAGPHAPLHVRVSSISVRPTAADSKPMPATVEETALARRFGWTQFTNPHTVNYVAHVAYVDPESRWGRDSAVKEYFAAQTRVLVIPFASDSPTVKSVEKRMGRLSESDDPVGNGVSMAAGYVFGVPPLRGSYDKYDRAYYEIPLVRRGSDWVLDARLRGVRVYYDYSEIQRAPGQRYYETAVKRPGWGPQEPLTYQGVKLFPPMYDRDKERYAKAHPDVRRVVDGILFDPRARVLIHVGYAEISR